jgi:hypothetical protein
MIDFTNKPLVLDERSFISPKYSIKELRAIVKCIISSQIALNANEEVKYTKYYKHNLKKKLNVSIKELISSEKTGFDTFIDSDIEVQATVVHDVLYLLIEEIGTVDFPAYAHIIKMIRAYQTDEKSIMGITKKILKNNK